jgi:hypothetical protein
MIQERLAVSQSVRSRLRRFVRSGDKGGISAAERQKARREYCHCSTPGLDAKALATQATRAYRAINWTSYNFGGLMEVRKLYDLYPVSPSGLSSSVGGVGRPCLAGHIRSYTGQEARAPCQL